MKKLFIIFFTIILMLINVVTVSAETNKYYIEELDMSLSIPSEYDTFFRGMDKNDPLFNKYGVDAIYLEDSLIESNSYLEAYTENFLYSINIAAYESNSNDYRYIDSYKLNIVLEDLIQNPYDDKIQCIDSGIYSSSQSKFLKTHMYNPEYDIFYIQYITVIDNIIYYFTIRSNNGEFSNEQVDMITSIMDSVVFESKPLMEELWKKTDRFLYEDQNTGIKFTVPENYEVLDDETDSEYYGANFISTQDEGVIISYFSKDVYKSGDIGFTGYERQEIDLSFITEEDITEELGNLKNVELTEIDGEKFYKVYLEIESEYDGISYVVGQSFFLTVKNGWLYMFGLTGGDGNDEFYDDLIQLIKSVEYPDVPNESSVITLPMLIVCVILIVIVFIIRRFKIKKANSRDSLDK